MEITEFKSRENVHQTHAEDLLLLGREGIEEFNDKIDKFISELNGGKAELITTQKIDGSPACVVWSKFPGYPDNSICLKSFITSNKNCLSSSEEIQAKYGDRPDMAEKLLYCLQLAKCIPENEAWQGDCLYTKGDLKEVEIHGKDYLTFHPNKIIYAFSEDNPTYNTIKNSDFGICFHTIYKPAAEGKKTQTFRVDAKRLNNVPENIYVMSPALNKSTNKADYNIDEVLGQYDELKKIESQLLSNSDYEDLCDNSVFMSYWNTFENANLSDKRAVNINVDTFFDELCQYIKDKQEKEYNKKMSTLKTDAGKQKAHDKYEADVIELEDILTSNREVLTLLVKALNLAANIKMNLWNGFKKADQGYNTFYKSKSKGYIPADMEGVALSDSEGNIVKVVDRSTFSFANRSDDIIGGFEHNESLEEDKDPAWVKNTINTVQNTDKDPNVRATKEYHKMKLKKTKKGQVITATPGLVGAIGESLNEDFNKTAVIAFGRMNPPTNGHNKLIDTMAQQEGDPKLYLSHTVDSKKNPLPYDQKLAYVNKAFGDRVEVVNSQAKTVIQALQELYDQGYENITYVGGEDRIGGEEDITKTIERYNGQPDKQGNLLYEFDEIKFVNAGARNANSEDPIESASASKARELARQGNLEAFKAIVPFDDETADDLYKDVRLGLNINEELLDEATFNYNDANKHNYYNDFINAFLTTGVRDKDGNIFNAPKNSDKEAIKAKLLELQPELKIKKDLFKNIIGQEWTKIDKAPFSGKGGENGQSAGQHAEPLVCYLFNGGKVDNIENDYSKEWLKSSIDSAQILKTNWNNKQFIAAHVDGDDISKIPVNAKNIASMFKAKGNAEQVLGLEKGTLNGLYAGSHKDDWCKADIVLINKKANIKELFKGVVNTETFNDALNAATNKNMIIPVSLKGLDPKVAPHLDFVSNSIELDKPGELKIILPKKELKSNDNNCSCWLMSDIGNIQFRRQSDTEDRLSIEVILSKAARGGKGVSKIQQELNLGGDWMKKPIKSEKALAQALRQITPNIEGLIPEGTEEYPGYNRTCFRGLVNLYKAYTNKFKGATAEDMFVWVMNNCVKSAVDYYKIS